MIDHHIQRGVVADLVECKAARFSDLKPARIDSNVFTYHLQTLIRQKYISKDKNGLYTLTSKGKLYGINSSLKRHELLEQAHSIILLCIRDGERWLLRKRLVQPLYGKIGFIHGEPKAGEAIEEAGKRILMRRTNLSAEFSVRGSGYVCIRDGEELVAYSHFTLLEAQDVEGELKTSDSHGENIWFESPDFTSVEMIPSMADIVQRIEDDGLFFVDLQYELK